MKLLKNNKEIIFFFLFFLVIGLLFPYGGDDWNNLLDGSVNNIFKTIEIAVADYNNWEGRFFSRIFLGLILPRKIIFSVISASIITFLYYELYNFIGKNNKGIKILLILAFLLVDFEAFAQVYVWKTGNITYLFPMLLFGIIFKIKREMFNNYKKNKGIIYYLFIPIIIFIMSIFVENVTVTFLGLLLFIVIYEYVKYKKIDYMIIYYFIISLIGFMIMLLSPGNAKRLMTEESFNSLSIIGKFIYNYHNLINYSFIKNIFLLLIMANVLSCYVYKNFNKRIIKCGLILYLTVIPIFTVGTNILTFLNNYGSIRFIWRLLDANLWYIMLYWTIYLFICLYIVIISIIKNKDMKLLLFLILGIINNGAMMMAPVWGGRTAYCTTIFLSTMFILMIDRDKINNIFKYGMYLYMLLIIIYSVYYCILVNYRDKYIEYQVKNDYDVIEVIIVPSYYTWNVTPWGEGFMTDTFKKVYNISLDKKISLVNRNETKIGKDIYMKE